jgi:hypothetical protein
MAEQKHEEQLPAVGTTATGPGVPVVDGICPAIRLAEAVVGLGHTTGKASTYAVSGLRRSLDGR